jgi:hypothetical protein
MARGGSGPPLLLLHGHAQNHVTWCKVAPRLAERYGVVAPDLRGYRDSAKPPSGIGHINHSKRAMAQDMIARRYFWWFLLIQPYDLPERLIGGLNSGLHSWRKAPPGEECLRHRPSLTRACARPR